jgi:DNA-binding transcriptional ArsR family regulator
VVAALLDGRAMTAGELARSVGVSAATASAHLTRLLDAGIVAVEPQGRHRYYRLANERAGRAFEALAALAPTRPVRSLRQSQIATELRWARTCYDHLAGVVAVALAQSLIERSILVDVGGDRYELGPVGDAELTEFGLDLGNLSKSRRSFARPCLDWSERRHHLAGALGAAVLGRMAYLGWVRQDPTSRAVELHDSGRVGIAHVFGCHLPENAHDLAS